MRSKSLHLIYKIKKDMIISIVLDPDGQDPIRQMDLQYLL